MSEEMDLDELAPWLALLITGIAVLLRVFMLGTKGMWLDETFSVWMAHHPLPDLLHWTIKIDQHPPLYYLLLHYWIGRYGDAPYAVRLLSVLFGVATIPIVYLIGKRMASAVVGLAAATFMALSLFNIYYAQEARMYTLLSFNAAVAIYALVRLLTDSRAIKPIGSQLRAYLRAWHSDEPVEPESKSAFSYADEASDSSGWRSWISRLRRNSIRNIETDLAWVALILFSAATLYSHNTAVLFLLAINLYVLGLMGFRWVPKARAQSAFRAPSLGNWIKAQVGVLLLWAPWLFFFIKQARTVDQRFWIPKPTWEGVLLVVKSFLNTPAPMPSGQATVIWSVYAVVLGLGVVYYRKKIAHFLLLAALFVVPFLGELLVSIRRPIFFDRTLIWTTIPLFLLLAAGVAQLKFRALMFLVLGSLGTINLFSTGDYYRFYQKEDWSTPAGYVANFAEKGDLILFNSNFVEIPFNYYFERYQEQYSLQIEEQGIPQDLFTNAILEPEMTTNDIPGLISLLEGHDRVWLVYSHDAYTDPTGLIPQTLATQRKLMQTRNFYGGQVQLYENP